MRGADSLRSLLETIGGFTEISVNAGIHPMAATAVAQHERYGSVSFEQDRHGRLRVTRCPHPDMQALVELRDRRIHGAEITFTSAVLARLSTGTKTQPTVYHTGNHETDSSSPTTAP